jgi:hypothetical protein
LISIKRRKKIRFYDGASRIALAPNDFQAVDLMKIGAAAGPVGQSAFPKKRRLS